MFHPDLRLLRCFAATAECRSLTRAASKLHLSQPTITGQLKEFERGLGFSLFERSTRSISLTAHGERLLPMVNQILELTNALRGEVEIIQKGEVQFFRLGAAIYTTNFPDRLALLESFAASVPDKQYVIDTRLQNDLVRDLVAGRLDAALLMGIAVPPSIEDRWESENGVIANETQFPSTLERVVLGRRRIGLFVPASSSLADQPIIRPEALAGQPVAMLSPEHGRALIEPLKTALKSWSASIVELADGNALAIEDYASRQGICCISLGWFPAAPGLVIRDVEGLDLTMDYSLVLGQAPNKAVKHLFRFAEQWKADRELLSVESVAGPNIDMSFSRSEMFVAEH